MESLNTELSILNIGLTIVLKVFCNRMDKLAKECDRAIEEIGNESEES